MAIVNRQLKRHDELSAHLRAQIVKGRWQPGENLPPQGTLVKDFAVSYSTLQSAFNTLQSEGFIESRGSRGTRVVERPPHRHHVGLVVPNRPNQVKQLWTQRCLEIVPTFGPRVGDLDLKVFHSDGGYSGSLIFQELEEHVRTRRLAGLVFLAATWPFEGTATLLQPGIARVAYEPQAEMPTINFDYRAWFDIVSQTLRERGVRRVAVVGLAELMFNPKNFNMGMAILKRHGLSCDPDAWQGAPWSTPGVAGNFARLLLQQPEEQRPEAFIVQDDNLLSSVISGVQSLGLRIQEDVHICSHCNLPMTDAPAVPVDWVGFPMRDAIGAGIESVRKQLAGETYADQTVIPPVVPSAITH